ncbi:MAG TPA: thioredoxin family protein [Bacteroidales bacterium]|nr:thioredoxin family protein [Bacteroidales bacterium]
MEIKILGPGCPKCKQLDRLVRDVVSENSIDATVIKVEDIVEIMNYGIMVTPALLINDKVVLKGSVPSKDEILKKIKEA